jgi:hypothetical protein
VKLEKQTKEGLKACNMMNIQPVYFYCGLSALLFSASLFIPRVLPWAELLRAFSPINSIQIRIVQFRAESPKQLSIGQRSMELLYNKHQSRGETP